MGLPPAQAHHLGGWGCAMVQRAVTGNLLHFSELCKHKLAAENLVSAQKLLEGEELALAKVTAGCALLGAGADAGHGLSDASLTCCRLLCCSCTTPP